MKEDIVDLLRRPCKVIVETIRVADCQFGMAFDERNAACVDCDLSTDCRWLGTMDSVRATQDLSAKELLASLQAGRELVLARIVSGHNVAACACEDCRWLRRSRRLLLQAGEKPLSSSPG